MRARTRAHQVDHTPLVTAPTLVVDIIREAVVDIIREAVAGIAAR
jgi:hypothetical protein